MPLLTKVSNQMGNAMAGCNPRDAQWDWPSSRNLDLDMVGKLTERGFIFWSHLYYRYRLTDYGVAAYDRWLLNRIENIRHWSRKYLLVYDEDHASHRACLLERGIDGAHIRDLEPWIVRRMIDNGLLQYESETDSWVAPVKSCASSVQSHRRPVCAG